MTINVTVLEDDVTKIISLGIAGFVLAMLLTPIYTYFAFKYKWHKVPRDTSATGEKASIFNKLHKKKHENGGLPTMSGIIFLIAASLLTIAFNWSREQTWLPLTALVGAGLVGLIDDVINIKGYGGGVAGLKKGMKFGLMSLVAAIGGWYFYSKLGYSGFHIPFDGDLELGWLIVPVFMLVVVSTANAVNISDGLDGLSGGLLTSAFGAFGVIALLQGNVGIAAFCVTIVGILMSYVWFNIHPARFMMGDIGSFALGTSLGVVAMLTGTMLLLPIIGFVFVAETSSSALQIISKKLRNGKKIFKVAPIHHHFEAIGWPETKVTMRFWVIGQIFAAIGVVLAIIGGHI